MLSLLAVTYLSTSCALYSLDPVLLEEKTEFQLTVYLVWGSEEEGKEKPPKELEKLIVQLKKDTKKKSFRLESKPTTETLSSTKPLSVKLPGGYDLKLSLENKEPGKPSPEKKEPGKKEPGKKDPGNKEKSKPSILQTITNPRKGEATIRLAKSTTSTQLDKIQKGKDTFILVVQYEVKK